MGLGVLGRPVCALVITAAAGMASPLLLQGTFPADDDVALFRFTLSAPGVVTLQSYGYAGGVANSTTIPAGGFAPDVTIFAQVGSDYVESTSDNGGHCGITGTDPVTGNCDDPYIQSTFAAGTYYLALSVYDNLPVDGFLADGFKQGGNPGFTCAEGGLSGQFCDVTDALFRTRTGNWAFTIAGVTSITSLVIPEPSTGWLITAAGLLGLLWRRKFC